MRRGYTTCFLFSRLYCRSSSSALPNQLISVIPDKGLWLHLVDLRSVSAKYKQKFKLFALFVYFVSTLFNL